MLNLLGQNRSPKQYDEPVTGKSALFILDGLKTISAEGEGHIAVRGDI